MSDYEKFKEKLPSKENFYSPLIGKKISSISNENDERLSQPVHKR